MASEVGSGRSARLVAATGFGKFRASLEQIRLFTFEPRCATGETGKIRRELLKLRSSIGDGDIGIRGGVCFRTRRACSFPEDVTPSLPEFPQICPHRCPSVIVVGPRSPQSTRSNATSWLATSSRQMGATPLLGRPRTEAKKPPHSFRTEQSVHCSRNAFFQSEMLLTANCRTSGGSTQS